MIDYTYYGDPDDPATQSLHLYDDMRDIGATIIMSGPTWLYFIAMAAVAVKPQNVDMAIVHAFIESATSAPGYVHDRLALAYLEYCMLNEGVTR